MSEWQSMYTAPTDGDFYLYGLTVKHRDGRSWFEVHYLALINGGDMIEASGDIFTEWSHSDFEYWSPAPAHLSAAILALIEPRTFIRAPMSPEHEQPSVPGVERSIKHMVNRFLGWKLPESFNPDGGISFKKTFNDHMPQPMKNEPSGTNLFDATQADAMVRYMIEGSGDFRTSVPGVERASDWPPPFELMKLQARKPGGDWIDIYSGQLQWVAKEGNDVRALEPPPSVPGVSKRPVAFRVVRPESNPGWSLFHDEELAASEAEYCGGEYQGLYVRDGTANAPSEFDIDLLRQRDMLKHELELAHNWIAGHRDGKPFQVTAPPSVPGVDAVRDAEREALRKAARDPKIVASVQQALMRHPHFAGGSALAFGFANTALDAFILALIEQPAVTPSDDLAKIADVIEPHWRGAGLNLNAEWIIKRFIELGDEVDASVPGVEREQIARIINGVAFRPKHISGDGLNETEKEKWLRARNVAYWKADTILALIEQPLRWQMEKWERVAAGPVVASPHCAASGDGMREVFALDAAQVATLRASCDGVRDALNAVMNWYTPPNDSGPFPIQQVADALALIEQPAEKKS
jgi:hypothetical protein